MGYLNLTTLKKQKLRGQISQLMQISERKMMLRFVSLTVCLAFFKWKRSKSSESSVEILFQYTGENETFPIENQ